MASPDFSKQKKALLIAGVLAVGAGVLVALYGRAVELEASGGEVVHVLVAAAPITAGTTLQMQHLQQKKVPKAYVHPAAVTTADREQILGQRVSAKLDLGQMLLWSDFATERQSAGRKLSASVPKGQRALTMPVNASSALGGMLAPGDRVDVIGTFTKSTEGAETSTVTLLQNVTVLAVGAQRDTTEARHDGQGGVGHVTLAVGLEESELLVFSMNRGKVGLVLRNVDDIAIVDDVPEKNFSDIFQEQKRVALMRKPRAVAAKPSIPTEPDRTIEVVKSARQPGGR